MLRTYQNGPGGFVIAVTHASGSGLLHFMAVDPTPQLMGQPANQRELDFFHILGTFLAFL